MNDIFSNFNIIQKHGSVYLDEALSKFGLYSCHRVFIKKIVETPGITRDKIKNIAHIHPSNTTRTIDTLEENGFLIKVIDEADRRICKLYPTDKLKEAYVVLKQKEQEWINVITEGMNETEVELYSKLLERSMDLSVRCIHKEK